MNATQDMSVNERADKQTIAVIGAGIVGVNCALALQRLGYDVTLIDKQAIGEGCSKGNAGHFATEQVFPLAEPSLLKQLPKMLLDPLGPVAISPLHFLKAIPWFIQFFNNMRAIKRDKNTLALKALNERAIDCYKEVFAEAKAEHLLVCKGSLLVFEKTPYEEIVQIQEQYQQAGVNVELLDHQQTLALEPNLNENIRYALYFTEVAHTGNPWQICLTLAQYAETLGMSFKQMDIASINQSKEGVIATDIHGTSCHFDQCVVATGAWSKNVLKSLGYHLPIEAERGYSLSINVSNDEPPVLSRPVASAERKFIMTPMDNMLRCSGTVEYAGLHASANYKRADLLIKNAEYILKSIPSAGQDVSNDAFEQQWMGPRPSLPDSLPVICQAPEHHNIFFAVGHQHLGLTQGAVTGKLIGQLVSQQTTDIDISPFCISRFN